MTFGHNFWISLVAGMIAGGLSSWYVNRLITKWFESRRKDDDVL